MKSLLVCSVNMGALDLDWVQIVKFLLENSWNSQRITKPDCQ